ncbi:hypothetical protein JOQ06_027235 [Pogonophryne albipinna]|uniref:Inactive rhomboid protein 1 n=1 Tax=Pogonophryne albipinna TaxID=1090488 RepID=A0AAD6FNI3_9TELE|nr:hypothetical protein JOQ06_027235 [Pogonophryne albipinna]
MDEPGSMNSSLQRKKPPWLQLDIPSIRLTPDDTPAALTQPVKRLRSVSMPGENPQTCIAALETSNNYLRPPKERLPSFTQSIKSGKRVRFERVNTVPPKGQRLPRRVSSVRRRSCIPKILSRRRSSIPKQIIRYRKWSRELRTAV